MPALVLSIWKSSDCQHSVQYFSDGCMLFQRDALQCTYRALVQTVTCRIVISIMSITKQLQNQSPTGGCVCSPEKWYLSKIHFSYVFFGNDHRLLFRCVPFSQGHCLGYLLQLSFNLSSTLNQLVRHHSQNSHKNAKFTCVSVL